MLARQRSARRAPSVTVRSASGAGGYAVDSPANIAGSTTAISTSVRSTGVPLPASRPDGMRAATRVGPAWSLRDVHQAHTHQQVRGVAREALGQRGAADLGHRAVGAARGGDRIVPRAAAR